MRLPLSIRLHESRSAILALTMIHGLAVAAVSVSRLALSVELLLLCPIVLSLVHGLRTHAWRNGPNAVVALTLREDGELELTYRNSRHVVTRIETSSVVSHWLIALQLRHERRLWLPLLADAMNPDEFRQLQVWLRGLAAGRQ